METIEEQWIRETGAIVFAAEQLEKEIEQVITEFIKRNSWRFMASDLQQIVLTALEDNIDTVKAKNETTL
jgi:hypothetical protein